MLPAAAPRSSLASGLPGCGANYIEVLLYKMNKEGLIVQIHYYAAQMNIQPLFVHFSSVTTPCMLYVPNCNLIRRLRQMNYYVDLAPEQKINDFSRF